MSTTPPATPAPHDPTAADTLAIAQAAVPAVDPTTQTPAEAQAAAAAAMQSTATERNVTLDTATINAIAGTTIARLEAMGAFENADTAPPPPTDTTPTDPAAPATVTPPPSDETPPRKLTFAEKFMGKS